MCLVDQPSNDLLPIDYFGKNVMLCQPLLAVKDKNNPTFINN